MAVLQILLLASTLTNSLAFGIYSQRISSRSNLIINKHCTDTNLYPFLFKTHQPENSRFVLHVSSTESDTIDTNPNRSSLLAQVRQKISSIFSNSGDESIKQKLAKLGASCLLSYGFISNVGAISMVLMSWAIHSKSTGLSPLKPGQWKMFLSIYAGFYVIYNIIRPLRFGLAVMIGPNVDKMVDFFRLKFNWHRNLAFGFVVFLLNILGTTLYLISGLLVISMVTGVRLY